MHRALAAAVSPRVRFPIEPSSLAVDPYSVQYQPGSPGIVREWKTPGGKLAKLRPVAATDAGGLAALARGLSFASRYFRFGRGDVEFADAELVRLCDPAHEGRYNLVVVTDEEGRESPIASARFQVRSGTRECDMAILVADAWHGSRVAHRLMSALIERARLAGLTRMHAEVLATNSRMLRFARRHGFAAVSGVQREGIRALSLRLDGETTEPQDADRAG